MNCLNVHITSSKWAQKCAQNISIELHPREAKKKAEESLSSKRRPLSAAPAPTTRLRMARPKSTTSLPSELLRSETNAMSRSNTTSELREQCNRQKIREREKR